MIDGKSCLNVGNISCVCVDSEVSVGTILVWMLTQFVIKYSLYCKDHPRPNDSYSRAAENQHA